MPPRIRSGCGSGSNGGQTPWRLDEQGSLGAGTYLDSRGTAGELATGRQATGSLLISCVLDEDLVRQAELVEELLDVTEQILRNPPVV